MRGHIGFNSRKLFRKENTTCSEPCESGSPCCLILTEIFTFQQAKEKEQPYYWLLL
jgi:hypothetical protein